MEIDISNQVFNKLTEVLFNALGVPNFLRSPLKSLLSLAISEAKTETLNALENKVPPSYGDRLAAWITQIVNNGIDLKKDNVHIHVDFSKKLSTDVRKLIAQAGIKSKTD